MENQSLLKPEFNKNRDFHRDLNLKVKNFLEQNKISRRDRPSHYLKSFIILSLAVGSYTAIYFAPPQLTFTSLLIWSLSGIFHTWLGFNLFHDSIHGGLSKSAKLNQVFAFISCSLLGVSHYMWRHKHNYLHHQFTNIEGWDDDLETREALRLSPYQTQHWRYRLQHWYAPFIYAMTSLEWVFLKDYRQYFSLKMNERQRIPALRGREHIEFWSSKLLYMLVYFVLPFSFFPWPYALLGLLVFHFSMSLMMASIFQLAHVMPDGNYPTQCPESGKIDMDWAKLQMMTTVNFGTKNRFLTWMAGGLNYQIEHHLFPNISHTLYPKIAPIVKATAEQYGLPYYELPSYSRALKDHFQMLKTLAAERQTI